MKIEKREFYTHSTPSIKFIFDEISAEPSTNKKMEILETYKENLTLKEVLYLANSKRIKFYIKQIPSYVKMESEINLPLSQALLTLIDISQRKVTGHAAIAVLQALLQSVTPDDAYIIERIIEKDCKIGMGTTNINKIFPKLIEKTPYMGAIAFDEVKARKLLDGGNCESQIKMDGRYANAIIRGGEVELESRDGEPTLLEDPIFLLTLRHLPDCVLNGELTIPGISRYDSNGIIASCISIAKKRSEGKDVSKEIKKFEAKHMGYYEALNRIVFTVWDTITVDEYYDNKSDVIYSVRKQNAINILNHPDLFNVEMIRSVPVSSFGEAMKHFQDVLVEGEEGTIAKSMDGTWKDGKPAWQMKMKLEMDVDLKIVGFNYGSKGTKNENVISSLNATSECGKVFTKPQGLSEEMMEYVTANQDNLLGTIIECKSCGLSNDSKGNYSLLHPVFKKLRDDKRVADDLDAIKRIESMVKGLEVL